jgi:hypothetical protein
VEENMKIKYTIKSIEFYKKHLDDGKVKIQWCPISQNVDCIMSWIRELGLTMLKTLINHEDNEWTFTLEGAKLSHIDFQNRLFKEGAKVYNISYHKTSWFD